MNQINAKRGAGPGTWGKLDGGTGAPFYECECGRTTEALKLKKGECSFACEGCGASGRLRLLGAAPQPAKAKRKK